MTIYFMVHWFYTMFWSLFDGWTLYFKITHAFGNLPLEAEATIGHHWWPISNHWWPFIYFNGLVAIEIDLIINVGPVTYIKWCSDFAFYLEEFFMVESHILGYWVSVMQLLTCKNCRSQWPIFHGPVILPYYSPLETSDFPSCIICTKNILVLFAKRDSGKLCGTMTVLISCTIGLIQTRFSVLHC